RHGKSSRSGTVITTGIRDSGDRDADPCRQVDAAYSGVARVGNVKVLTSRIDGKSLRAIQVGLRSQQPVRSVGYVRGLDTVRPLNNCKLPRYTEQDSGDAVYRKRTHDPYSRHGRDGATGVDLAHHVVP